MTKTNGSNYSEKLKDPRWQRKRLEIFQRDNFTCVTCHATDVPLNVHHSKYATGEVWDIDNKYLLTLCENCHSLISSQKEARKKAETELLDFLREWNYQTDDIEKIIDILTIINDKRHTHDFQLITFLDALEKFDADCQGGRNALTKRY